MAHSRCFHQTGIAVLFIPPKITQFYLLDLRLFPALAATLRDSVIVQSWPEDKREQDRPGSCMYSFYSLLLTTCCGPGAVP